MAYKQQMKSPIFKALKGNQGKLPQHLQEAIKAAPESPANQTKEEAAAYMDGLREKRAQKAEKSGDKGRAQRIRSTKNSQDGVESVAKQTTAAEFAYEKSLKEKETGKSTKVVDKLTSALEAPFSDKTYSELKKEKRAKQKAKYNAKK